MCGGILLPALLPLLFLLLSFSLAARLLWLLLFNIEPGCGVCSSPSLCFSLVFCTLQHTQHKVVACHNDRVLDSCFSPSLSPSLAFVLFCFSMRNHLFFSQDSTTLCPVVPWYCPGSALETFCVHSYLNLSCGFSHCCQSSAVSAVSEKRLLRSFSRCTQGCG